jgi:formate C-acetyltransferase
MESRPGGNYFHLITILDLSTHGAGEEYEKIGVHIDPFEGSDSFEELYRRFLGNVIRPLRQRCSMIGKYGKLAPRVNPLPLFSASMAGCIENRRDYSAGGGKYNSNEFDPAEFANAVDGLLAIKTLCFDTQQVKLNELLSAVRNNWEGQELLLKKVKKCPHFGDDTPESIALSRRLFNDIYENTRDIENERGGKFYMDFYVYREFRLDAEKTRATIDGRRNGDLFAMGICPTRYREDDSLTSMAGSIASLDNEKCINHSVTIQLPAGDLKLPEFTAMLRALAASNLKHIQINCVDIPTLQDARLYPEQHQDLVVRVCGFSAKYVSLSPEWQEEFINRKMYQPA